MKLVVLTVGTLVVSAYGHATKEAFEAKYYNGKEPEFTGFDALGNPWLSEEELIKVWNASYIERIEDDISVEEFKRRFVDMQKPVVLSGAHLGGFGDVRDEETLSRWNWQTLKKKYGHVSEVYKLSSRHFGQDCIYSNLCPVGRISLKELIEGYIETDDEIWQADFRKRKANGEDVVIPYLRDLPLSIHFKELDQDVKFPRQVHDDFMAGFAMTQWPTSFIAPAGTRSEIHNDYGGTAFTMTPLFGRKAFALFPLENRGVLEGCFDEYHDGPDETMETMVDVWNPDFEKCSRIITEGVSPHFTTLYPGDVLYVPNAWMHAVRNFEANIGITRNFLSADYLLHSRSSLRSQAEANGVEDWNLASVYDLASRVAPFQDRLTSSQNNEPLMNRKSLLVWNRLRVLDLIVYDQEVRDEVEQGVAIVHTRRNVREIAEALGFEPLPGQAHHLDTILPPSELLETNTWAVDPDTDEGGPIYKAFDRDTAYEFWQEMERRKRLLDFELKREAWGGYNATQQPSQTDNENFDALGEGWYTDEHVVSMWNGSFIDVVSDITWDEFQQNYVQPQIPVVFRGPEFGGFGDSDIAKEKWTWERFRDIYGHIEHETKWSSRHYEQDCSIGLLCPTGEITMRSLVDDYIFRDNWQEELRAQEKQVDTVPYLRDLSLENFFPDLYDDVEFTSLVWENMLDIQNFHWPTAFFGPAGSRSELHHDFGGTAFTMTPLFGRKTFALFPNYQESLIMQCHHAREPIIDVFNPDFDNCPQAREASLFYTTLQPGDVLYVPPLWMHSIRNPDASVGITRNFISLNEISTAEDALSQANWDVDPSLHPSERFEGLDFALACAWEMALLLNESEAYQKRRRQAGATKTLNRKGIKAENRRWLQEACAEDPDLDTQLHRGLPIFAMITYAALFDLCHVTEGTYDLELAESTYPFELLHDAAPLFTVLDDEDEAGKVLAFLEQRKMNFAKAFAQRVGHNTKGDVEAYDFDEDYEWEDDEDDEYEYEYYYEDEEDNERDLLLEDDVSLDEECSSARNIDPMS